MNDIMFFDTETNGLPQNYKAPATLIDNWPRVIQLAWLVATPEGETIKSHEALIRPNGWTIPKEKFWIQHGFDTDASLRDGRELAEVLGEFVADLQRCNWIVSHNLAFDHPIVAAEMIRLAIKSERKPNRICTMESTVELCQIPFAGQRAWLSKQKGGGKNFKWPKLEELHQFLFGEDFGNKHQASGDVAALKACFFELVKRKVFILQLPTP